MTPLADPCYTRTQDHSWVDAVPDEPRRIVAKRCRWCQHTSEFERGKCGVCGLKEEVENG